MNAATCVMDRSKKETDPEMSEADNIGQLKPCIRQQSEFIRQPEEMISGK
jgi:hypothetical protein